MIETVWVLDRAYELTTNEIAAAVERMLQTSVLVVENEQQVFAAMIPFQGRARLVRRCSHRRTRCASGMFRNLDI